MLLKLWLKIHSNLIILSNCRRRLLICWKDGCCSLSVGDQGRLLISQLLLIRLDSGHLGAVGLFSGKLGIDRVSLMLLNRRVAVCSLQLGELGEVMLLKLLLLLHQQMVIQIVLVQTGWLWRDANLTTLS